MASIRKLPSGTYRVRWRWRDAAGNERGATAPTKKAALALKAQTKVDAFHGVHRDPKAGRRAFGSYLTEMLKNATDLRPATRERYRIHAERYVTPEIGGAAIASIGPEELRRFYAKVWSRSGTATVEAVHRLVSRTLSQAVADGIIASNPARYAKAPRAQRKPVVILEPKDAIWLAIVLENRELFAPKHYYSGGSAEEWRVARKQALDEVERWQTDVWGPYDVLGSDRERLGYYRDRPSETGGGLGVMVLVGMFAGLRFGEAAALRVSSVKLGAEPRVTVLEAATEVRGVVAVGPPKTAGSLRTIPISRALADILHEHIQRDRSPDRFLFTTPTGKVLSRTRFAARIWNPAVRLADIAPHPTFHDLRHSYAAWLIANHVHPKVIQERLGHSSIRTTLDVTGT